MRSGRKPLARLVPAANNFSLARVNEKLNDASMLDAELVIRALALERHPEGGWFRETFRDAHTTAIYYLLRNGEASHWHRIAQSETWHFYAGAPLALRLSRDGKTVERHTLGTELMDGARPQLVVPSRCWQAARSLGAWSLVGCTVAPPFAFAGFELAPDGWEPYGT